MDLRPGVTNDECKRVLIELALAVENVRGFGSGPDLRQHQIFANKYLAWVDEAEFRQRALWCCDDWLADLHTTRWQMIATGSASPRLVNGEIDFQAQRLRGLAELLLDEQVTQRSMPVQNSLSLDGMHPSVVAACSSLFDTGHFSDAIFAAYRAVEMAVREASGLELTGVNLMNQAMRRPGGVLRMSSLPGQAGEDEQQGMRALFAGAMQGIRNPKAHGHFSLQDRQKTLEYLAFASLLLRRLDDAARVEPGQA